MIELGALATPLLMLTSHVRSLAMQPARGLVRLDGAAGDDADGESVDEEDAE